MSKRTINLIGLILVFVFLAVLFHFFGGTASIFYFLKKVNKNEISILTIQVVGSVIVSLIILSSCYMALSLARKKNRNPKLWVLICFFINYWGILILYYLPKKGER